MFIDDVNYSGAAGGAAASGSGAAGGSSSQAKASKYGEHLLTEITMTNDMIYLRRFYNMIFEFLMLWSGSRK